MSHRSVPFNMTTTAPTRPPDHATRLWGAIVGLLIFLAGIALIGYVFATARTLFDAPPPLIPANAFATPTPAPSAIASAIVPAAAASPDASHATTVITQNLAQFVQKLLLLLVMCIVGSVVASKGIDLFFKALAAPRHPAAVPPPTPPALPPPD